MWSDISPKKRAILSFKAKNALFKAKTGLRKDFDWNTKCWRKDFDWNTKCWRLEY